MRFLRSGTITHFVGLVGLKDIDYLNRKTRNWILVVEKMNGKGIMLHICGKRFGILFKKLENKPDSIKCGVGNFSKRSHSQKAWIFSSKVLNVMVKDIISGISTLKYTAVKIRVGRKPLINEF
jgi:hypothetical protein